MCKPLRWYVAVSGFLLLMNTRGLAQSACLTNADTAGRHQRMIIQLVTMGDSARLVSQGLPYNPSAGVTLVTDTRICSKVIAAINAQMPAGDPRRLTQAYVLKMGNSAYAAVGRLAPDDYAFFDTKYKWLASMGALN